MLVKIFKIVPIAVLLLSWCALSEAQNDTSNGTARSGLENPNAPDQKTGNACASRSDTWKTYRNEKYGYEVKYPEDWQATEAVPRKGPQAVSEKDVLFGEEVQKITFLQERYADWQGEFQIKVLANPHLLSLEEWVENLEIEDVTGGSLIQEQAPEDLDGKSAIRLSIFGFDHEEIAVIGTDEKARIYFISFTGRNPNDSEVAEHRRTYKQMLATFRFIRDGDEPAK